MADKGKAAADHSSTHTVPGLHPGDRVATTNCLIRHKLQVRFPAVRRVSISRRQTCRVQPNNAWQHGQNSTQTPFPGTVRSNVIARNRHTKRHTHVHYEPSCWHWTTDKRINRPDSETNRTNRQAGEQNKQSDQTDQPTSEKTNRQTDRHPTPMYVQHAGRCVIKA